MYDYLDLSGLQGIDVDDDGVADAFASDTDGDGVLEIIDQDYGNYGIMVPSGTDTHSGDYGTPEYPVVNDVSSNYADIGGDGIIDSIQYTYTTDTDGDGIPDTTTVETDYGMDGSIDFAEYVQDADGDGIIDIYGQAFSVDSDGDGIYDSLQFANDVNLDGVFDVQGIVHPSGQVEFIDVITDSQSQMPDEDTINAIALDNASQLDHFNPNDYDPDQIIGDPAEAMESYHVQETGTSCAVAAQEFVLEQLTGNEYSESDLRDFAQANQWYSPEGGTPMEDVGNILESQGLAVDHKYDANINDIANCLENGGAVIVGVDVYDMYDVEHDYGPGMDANHAVQVIGIDNSDPDNPMVIVNDSSNADGGGAMIPMEDFMDAWTDSGCMMVEAYA